MSKFKEGDVVICVDNKNGGNYLTVGLSYDVLAHEDEGRVSVCNDEGWVSYYYESDFKLVEEDVSISEEFVEVPVDMVNNPSHYTSHPSNVECIEITRHMGFNLGNAMKYIWRCDLKKDAIEDLKKAVFYLNDEIALRESKKQSVNFEPVVEN